MVILCATCDVDLPCVCGPACTCEDPPCEHPDAPLKRHGGVRNDVA